MNIKFSPPDISELEIDEVVEALRSGWITTGPRTKLLERRLAAYIATGATDVDCTTQEAVEKYGNRVVCLSSATASEEMNLRMLGIGPGDEVIVPAYTYTASASAALHCGASVKFVDVQKDGDSASHMPEMDYDKLEHAIGPKTKAIVAVDLGGIVYTYEKEGAVVVPPVETEPQAPATEPTAVSAAGYWTLKYSEGNEEMAMDEDTVAMLKEMGIVMYVDLKEDGTGIFMLDDVMPITWSNGKFVADDGSEASYTLESGELIVDIEGTIMHFVPGEGSAPTVTESETQEPENEFDDPILNFWEGDWYGWWVVWSGDGTYDSLEDSAWDAYAHIDVNDDYTGTVTLWEVDSSREDPIAVVDVSFRTGISEYGCMVSESGWFMDCEVSHADWNLDVGASMVRMFDKMIAIDSYYYEPENDDNSFNYVFILRPWGMDWEDVRGVDAEGTYYSDMMPIEYENWYLPLIESGVDTVPDSYQAGLDLIG